jgi:hypothetical protein
MLLTELSRFNDAEKSPKLSLCILILQQFKTKAYKTIASFNCCTIMKLICARKEKHWLKKQNYRKYKTYTKEVREY